jgi:hypothetical protein
MHTHSTRMDIAAFLSSRDTLAAIRRTHEAPPPKLLKMEQLDQQKEIDARYNSGRVGKRDDTDVNEFVEFRRTKPKAAWLQFETNQVIYENFFGGFLNDTEATFTLPPQKEGFTPWRRHALWNPGEANPWACGNMFIEYKRRLEELARFEPVHPTHELIDPRSTVEKDNATMQNKRRRT